MSTNYHTHVQLNSRVSGLIDKNTNGISPGLRVIGDTGPIDRTSHQVCDNHVQTKVRPPHPRVKLSRVTSYRTSEEGAGRCLQKDISDGVTDFKGRSLSVKKPI